MSDMLSAGDPAVVVNDATVECEIFISTRQLLDMLWRRFLGWNSNFAIRIACAKVVIVRNRATDSSHSGNNVTK